MNKIIKEASLVSPIGSFNVTSGFGPRWGRFHHGVDLSTTSGTEIKSPLDGRVIEADFKPGACGGTIAIEHADNMKTRYCHCKDIRVSKGQMVKKGDMIGLTGGGANDKGKGNSMGPHLHFEVYKNGKTVNPKEYLGQNVGEFVGISGDTKQIDDKSIWDDFGKDLGSIKAPRTNTDRSRIADPLLKSILDPMFSSLGLKTEMKVLVNLMSESYQLVNAQSYDSFSYVIEAGKKIINPLDGVVSSVGTSNRCQNSILVNHQVNQTRFTTEFCNVDKISVSAGDKVGNGKKLGIAGRNTTVRVYDSTKSPMKFSEIPKDSKDPKDPKKPEERNIAKNRKSDPLLNLILKPLNTLNLDLDKDIKTVSKSDEVPEAKPISWLKRNTVSMNESFEQEVKKIKKLL